MSTTSINLQILWYTLISGSSTHLQPEAAESVVNSNQEGNTARLRHGASVSVESVLRFLYVLRQMTEVPLLRLVFFFLVKEKWLLFFYLSFTRGTRSHCMRWDWREEPARNALERFLPEGCRAEGECNVLGVFFPPKARDGLPTTSQSIFSLFFSNPPPSHPSLIPLIRV